MKFHRLRPSKAVVLGVTTPRCWPRITSRKLFKEKAGEKSAGSQVETLTSSHPPSGCLPHPHHTQRPHGPPEQKPGATPKLPPRTLPSMGAGSRSAVRPDATEATPGAHVQVPLVPPSFSTQGSFSALNYDTANRILKLGSSSASLGTPGEPSGDNQGFVDPRNRIFNSPIRGITRKPFKMNKHLFQMKLLFFL